MSSVRVPGSLRRIAGARQNQAKQSAPKKESKAAALFTAALLTAASPISIAVAQGTLPPLKVETTEAKKKAKSPRAAKSGKAAPQATTEQPPPGTAAKDANPHANPNAPYNVERSASGKLTERLVDTPRTVTAIPKEVLEDTAVRSIRELARQTPGVTLGFGEGGNAFGDRIYIRGFDARGDIYVDGIRDPGNASREVFAVEQVEIYKGPASTIGGRGTAGGALNIITKKPNDEYNFLNVSTMFGTDHTFRTTVDVNQIFSPALAVRGNLLFHDGDVAGRDVVEDQRWGGFLSAAFRPSDSMKITLDYYRYRTDGIPDFGVPLNQATKQPWPESGVPRSSWYGNAARDFMKNDQDIFTATAEVKLSDNAKLTSRTRLGKTVVDYIASGPTSVDPILETVNTNNPQRYQEADLIANQTDVTFIFNTFGLRHTMVAGTEFSREEISRYSYSGLSGTTQSLYNPNPFPPWSGVIPPRAWSFDATIDTKAAYLLDTIKINPQWSIHGGLRVDHYERTQVASNPNNTASREDTLWNWHAGIVYKPIPIASFYAAYGTSSNPVGSELDATGVDYGGLGAAFATLDPERNTSIELGTKWELFNGRLLATAALFQTDKENARENGSPPTSTGAYRVRGVELGVQGNVTERWSVYGGLVVMDTEVTKSSNPASIGRELANIPTTQFSLLTKYRLTERLTVGAQATYANETYAGLFAKADSGFFLPSYWRFDALAEYKFTDNFSAQFNVVNLTDEVYYDALYRSASPFVFIAPGRAAYLTLNWRY